MEQTERLIEFFRENKNALSQISAEEVRDVVYLTTIVLEKEEYSSDLKESAYSVLCNIAMLDTLMLEERWAIYMLLDHKMFVSAEYDRFEQALDDVYDMISSIWMWKNRCRMNY